MSSRLRVLRRRRVFAPLLCSGVAARGGGGLANAETTTWVNAVVGDGGSVSAGRQTLVDNLITSLKGASIFTKLDRLWLFASENSQSALRDIKAASAATATSSPTFTTDRGYTGNGSTAYINTNFTPSTAGGIMTQDSAHISAYDLTNRTADANKYLMGCSNGAFTTLLLIGPEQAGGSGNDEWGCNGGIVSSGAAVVTTSQGFHVVTRTASNAAAWYVNGNTTAVATSAGASVGLPDAAVLVLSLAQGVNPLVRPTTDECAAASIGGALNSTEQNSLAVAVNAYMAGLPVPINLF